MVSAVVYAAHADGRKCAAQLPACVGTGVSEAALSSWFRFSARTLTSLGLVSKDDGDMPLR